MTRIWKTRHPGIARFSSCMQWRWWLTRELGGARTLVSIGLNPSTATEEFDDPTIAKEQGFASRWSHGRYIKVNAYGWRATKPKDMFAARDRGIDIVGTDNDAAIREAIAIAVKTRGIVLAAWGGNIEPARQAAIAALAGDVPIWCVKRNDDGTAKHPLYARNDSKLIRWYAP